jgi:thioredoxin-like negative regulator of GroEL
MEDQEIKGRLEAASKLLANEEFSEAAKAYRAILDSGTTTEEVRLGLAKSLYGAERYDEAVKAFQAILDSGTTTEEVRLGLAKSFHNAERYDEAEKAFQAILDSGQKRRKYIDGLVIPCTGYGNMMKRFPHLRRR